MLYAAVKRLCLNLRIALAHAVVLLALVPTPARAAYQFIFDGEDTAYRVKSGNWLLDKTGSFLGNYRFSAAGPGTGSSVAVWDIDGIPDGTYLVEFYVDNGNYAAAAEFGIEHDSGTTTITRSQNFVGTGWHNLGTFTFTGAGRINQTDKWAGAGTKVIADALRLTLQTPLPAAPSPDSVPPEVTIVVDDLGALSPTQPGTFTNTLFTQAPQLTYAVMPTLQYTNAVLQNASTLGIMTILHQPMEYIGMNPNPALETDRLYTALPDAQNRTRLSINLDSELPYIWGLNNHQGSLFSQYKQGMEVVVDELKYRNFFFLDSRTISDSVGYDVAKDKGLLTGERDLFVDGLTVADTRALIESIGQRAILAPNYNYIMICHQRTNTVPGLLQAIDTLETSGIVIKRLDHNLHYIMEVDDAPPGATVSINGNWTTSSLDMISHECRDGSALTISNSQSGSIDFAPVLPKTGSYRVFVASGYEAGLTEARVVVSHNGGTSSKIVSLADNRNRWIYVGTYPFTSGIPNGPTGNVSIQQSFSSGGSAAADAVKFVYDGEFPARIGNWQQFQ